MKKYYIIIMSLMLLVFISCGVNNNPVEPELEEILSAHVTIHAPTFARTAATNNLWLGELEIELPLPEETIDTSGGNGHAKLYSAINSLVDTTLSGMGIEFELYDGFPMIDNQLGQWFPIMSESNMKHLQVIIEDAVTTTIPGDTLYARITNSTVEMVIEKDGLEVEEHHLEPIYGENGFYFGENFTLTDTGTYTVIVTMEQPLFARDVLTAEKWMDNYVDTFSYFYDGQVLLNTTSVGESVNSEGLMMDVDVTNAISVWNLEHDGTVVELAPDSLMSHHFMVTIEDSFTVVQKRRIGYTEVKIEIASNLTDSVLSFECISIFGKSGLHYGKNIIIPTFESDDSGGGHEEEETGGGGH